MSKRLKLLQLLITQMAIELIYTTSLHVDLIAQPKKKTTANNKVGALKEENWNCLRLKFQWEIKNRSPCAAFL